MIRRTGAIYKQGWCQKFFDGTESYEEGAIIRLVGILILCYYRLKISEKERFNFRRGVDIFRRGTTAIPVCASPSVTRVDEWIVVNRGGSRRCLWWL